MEMKVPSGSGTTQGGDYKVRCKTLLYCTIEMTTSWKLLFYMCENKLSRHENYLCLSVYI